MNAYIDASVVLRKLLSEPAPLVSWKKITKPFASRLIRAQVGRVIDGLRLAAQIDDQDVAQLHT